MLLWSLNVWERDCGSWRVTSTLFSKERKLSDGSNQTSDNSALTVGNWEKNNSKKKESTRCVDN